VAYVRTARGGVFRRVGEGEGTGSPHAPQPAQAAEAARVPTIVQRAAAAVQRAVRRMVQRSAAGAQPDAGPNVAAEIESATAAGNPLPLSVRRFMEPRFRADFSNVRVHTDDRSATLNRQLGARAFAVGNQLFFGRGQFRPDTGEGRELIAHELTHTLQQGAAVRRSEEVQVTQQSPVRVQRLGISDALDYFADRANHIPGFRMFTIVLGVNPINMSRVERSAANVLRAVVEFIPGGALITRALDEYGVFDRVGTWMEQQIRTLGMTGGMIRDAINRFLDSLSWRDIFRLGDVWDRARRIFTEPIDRLLAFGRGLVTGILGFIRDAILRPLAGLASRTRGYDLLKAILGRDPITGEAYPRNADTLIGGFMKLIGQEEVWENIKRANAVARAWAWFQSALSGLLGFVTQIPSLFMQALRSLELMDIVVLPRAFARVGAVFLDVGQRFISWAGTQVLNLLQIIFEVVAPGAMVYLRRAAGALSSIFRNPVGFIGNLVRAGILGFRQFAGRFLTHLRGSLVAWLTGTLAGANIYIPQAFTLREIIRFVLSVLGLTWQNLRQKFVRAIGEPAVRALETGFDVVLTLVTQGPAAAWERIQEGITNLREMVMEQIMTFVQERVVQAAITRLLTSLNPAGAFVQAVIAIYNTVMFFVERLRQISQVAMSFIDSMAAIASGSLAAAANRVETTMAGLLTLVISFLARIAGLGRVSDAVVGIINRVRAPIDRALDRVVDWIVAQARRLGRLVARGATAAAGRITAWWRARKTFVATDRSSHSLYFRGEGASAVLTVETTPTPVRDFLRDVRSAALASPDPAVVTAYRNAVAKSADVDRLRTLVETGANPRQPADVDALNADMEALARILPPLIPVLYPPAAAAPGSAPVGVGELIKITRANLVAVVTGLEASSQPGVLVIKFRVVSPRTERSSATLPVGLSASTFGRDFTRHTDDPRELYLGATPPKDSDVGRRVKQRMRAEGRYRVLPNGTEEVLYARDGRWWNVRDCDMGHVIDAVTWWNSNGRLTGARSSAVQQFMRDPDNYAFEPSGPNQARGAALAARGLRYLPPVV
jgi:hypothetical protein